MSQSMLSVCVRIKFQLGNLPLAENNGKTAWRFPVNPLCRFINLQLEEIVILKQFCMRMNLVSRESCIHLYMYSFAGQFLMCVHSRALVLDRQYVAYGDVKIQQIQDFNAFGIYFSKRKFQKDSSKRRNLQRRTCFCIFS